MGGYSVSLVLAAGAYLLFVMALAFSASSVAHKIAEQTDLQRGMGRLQTACAIVDSLAAAGYPAAGDFEELEGISFNASTALFNAAVSNKTVLLERKCVASASGGRLVRTGLQ